LAPQIKALLLAFVTFFLGTPLAGWAEVATPRPAAPVTTPAATTNTSLSATAVPRKAAWQQRLTLGPGDVLSVGLFEMPETLRPEVLIGPDGRLSYLKIEIRAEGLTIDELRAKLDDTLGQFYQNPRSIVTPVTLRSKKYFVLGAVANKGVYNFDRPVTVIEAVARAGGLETGQYEQRTVELVDLAHSFIARGGQRLSVDFERLFQRGDLSQNVPLEPEDYVYFASASGSEIYVLGEVASPGTVAFAQRPTALSVITMRGGFSEHAFKHRVLVVRGSLNHPETFIVNTAAILAGKSPDFKLQSRDIVYVSANPWLKVEDLLDTAARAFLQGMLVEWTTLRVGPLITEPLIK